MTAWAVRPRNLTGGDRLTAKRVRARVDRLEVVRSDTRSIAAQMVELLAGRNLPDVALVRLAVGSPELPADGGHTIALAI
jgi:hypothetical protein